MQTPTETDARGSKIQDQLFPFNNDFGISR
jgi:hypothetical protein